jgi:DNA polymerase-3 subunit alpha
MTKYYQFDCGCKFPVDSENTELLEFDVNSIPLDCSRTWELISDGNTKGCFQLESRLGQSMAKKLKPENIEQLAGLISIMRPGCLEAIREGKSVSNHFIDRKNGQESIDYYNPSLKNILETTYGEMVYQEQSMQIAQELAGFDLQEADMLRKAIGKKKPEEMAKLKTVFINGCNTKGIVNAHEAEEIFGWIEKSQRYSFNKSHAISYAINGYLSAYAKAHFPQIFFVSYLRFAKDKIDPHQEIKELVHNASSMNIEVLLPKFKFMNKEFTIIDNKIYFGLTNIKGVGESVYEAIEKLHLDLINKNITGIIPTFCRLLTNVNSAAAKAIVSVGAFDDYKIPRTELLFYLEMLNKLTKKELEQITTNNIDITSIKFKDVFIKLLTTCKVTKKRQVLIQEFINSIDHPPYSLKDNMQWIAETEAALLGIPLTCTKTDCYMQNYESNLISCKDFQGVTGGKKVAIMGEISRLSVIKTKQGKNKGANMSFLEIFDSSGGLDSVVMFPEQYGEFKDLLKENEVLVFIGTKSKKAGSGLIVEKCFIPES